ncbi:L-ascorbate metabolism protein UlaG, beta-lactamase superfamily [Reichenbachiella faecimaris]|uniref:L-ascorbate metabolism protein UlaG, beta-lactamase superfamily n=1 Tax=Reichenbachiella faecimaris TaxID=692418 RepID=A0A1W2GKI0_REIFA|nr:MBL fold metallo-hydrolase [Reichenbachiella faecimaris]SMD37064.1 L-ascorbate metabolism protein UlaG, beta-lactamase superfamily [Reichenbachiella faecimaris]
MRYLRSTFLAFLFIFSFSVFSQKATYIANSGVLIQSGSSKILIDAFFTDGKGRFLTPESAQLDAMVAERPPYNNLSLALATHAHPDHFSPQQIGKLLFTNKKLNCLATPQVVDSIEAVMVNFESIHDRTLTFPLSRSWKTYTQEGLTVKAAYSRHAGKSNAKVQDLIYLIEINGKKILHLGDADMDTDRFEELKLDFEEIDIAFVPFWYMTNFYGAEFVKQHIAAKKVVAVHVPDNYNPQSLAKIKNFLPNAIIFDQPGQSVTF